MNKEFEKLFKDRRTQKVLGFLIAKGLLLGGNVQPQPNVKVTLEEALWVGETVEPRVIEVLTTALLHFPKTFIETKNMPPFLKDIIVHIKKHHLEGPDYRGILYRDMKKWAERLLTDKRTKPLSEIRVNKTYRFNTHVLQKMHQRAKAQKMSVTQYLENLIKKDIEKS